MRSLTLVIMAAGIGQRFGGIKQLAAVGPSGEPPAAYSIYDALRAGFGRVVFIIRREMEHDFRERIGRFAESRAETAYVFQENDRLPPGFKAPHGRQKPWGTAHAIFCCREAVGGHFVALNADDIYGPTAFRLLADWLSAHPDSNGQYSYCMPGYLLRNTLSPHGEVSRGICEVSPDDFLIHVVERKRVKRFSDGVKYAEDDGRWVAVPEDSVVSMNMWGFTPSIFGELERRFARFLERHGQDPSAEYYLPTVVGELVAERRARVKVLRTDDAWHGMTYRADLEDVRQAVRDMIQRGLYPERLH